MKFSKRRLFVKRFIINGLLIVFFLLSCGKKETLQEKLDIQILKTQHFDKCSNMQAFRILNKNTIVVQDRYPKFIKTFFFNADSFVFKSEFGERGKAPNEFSFISSFDVKDDTLKILDRGNARIATYVYKDDKFINGEFKRISDDSMVLLWFNNMELRVVFDMSKNALLINKTNGKVILEREKFSDNPEFSISMNYLLIQASDNYLYVLYPYVGKFLILNKNLEIIKDIRVDKLFHIEGIGMKMVNGKFKEKICFRGFSILNDDLVLFYNKHKEYTKIFPLDWRKEKPLSTVKIDKKINWLDNFGEFFIGLEAQNIVIMKLKKCQN